MKLRARGQNTLCINPASKDKKIVIVRSERLLAEIRIGLNRTTQNLLKRLDFPIKSRNGKLLFIVVFIITPEYFNSDDNYLAVDV